jgi:hypothetical protein
MDFLQGREKEVAYFARPPPPMPHRIPVHRAGMALANGEQWCASVSISACRCWTIAFPAP